MYNTPTAKEVHLYGWGGRGCYIKVIEKTEIRSNPSFFVTEINNDSPYAV